MVLPKPTKLATPAPLKPDFVHPEATHAKKKNPNSIEPISAFYLFFAASICSALYAPIQDCDETFNYWEPTHYLTHGYGLQTWEYSPEYAIRSWLYVGLHALVGTVRRILPQSSKVAEFYFIRCTLAFVCALCQTLLFRVINSTIHPRIAIFFVVALCSSPGNFNASTAFLPSSFAMYSVMLGAAAFMDWRGGLKTLAGIFWFSCAALIGWPFAAALCAPFVAEEGLLALLGGGEDLFQAFIRMARGAVAALLIQVADSAVNTFFYRKIVAVSWNIVKYNVLSSHSGPNLYGTEPWTFYFKNLALNFNIWFVLALAALPLFLLRKLLGSTRRDIPTAMRAVVFMLPFYLWLSIFTLQPHKEERFMYPAYPFLALNAAFSLHILLEALGGGSGSNSIFARVPAMLKLLAVLAVLLGSLAVGLLRIYGVYSGYAAPLSIYRPLYTSSLASPSSVDGIGRAGEFVCFGKDWYRFPTSYFLPRGMHAKFIRSEFRGLLPGEFSEASTGFGLWSGAWLLPSGMNDQNLEDVSKYTDLRACDFLVDTQLFTGENAGQEEEGRRAPLPPLEPDYVADTDNWEVVQCLPFLDAAHTSSLARALWTPSFDWVPEKYRRKWVQHCLLRRRQQKQQQ